MSRLHSQFQPIEIFTKNYSPAGKGSQIMNTGPRCPVEQFLHRQWQDLQSTFAYAQHFCSALLGGRSLEYADAYATFRASLTR